MSGGEWDYQEDAALDLLIDIADDLERDAEFQKSGKIVRAFAEALRPYLHDLDWHFSSDSLIKDEAAFDLQMAEGLSDALRGVLLQKSTTTEEP